MNKFYENVYCGLLKAILLLLFFMSSIIWEAIPFLVDPYYQVLPYVMIHYSFLLLYDYKMSNHISVSMYITSSMFVFTTVSSLHYQ